MKYKIIATLVILILLAGTGCSNRGQNQSEEETAESAVNEPDTGFTGIGVYRSGNLVSAEVTMKNGIRHGIMKTYYPSGKLRQTFWYENGMREDTAIWYHEDGVIFRKTPYKRDSVNGIQIQYYKSGKVRAKLEFIDGLRTPYLEEFSAGGTKITSYPEVVVRTKDDYNINGTYKIYLSLSNSNVKSNFYRGEFINNLFNPGLYTKINDTEMTGFLELKKSGSAGSGYVGVIAEILTTLGNRQLVYKRIDLPYNDLK